MLIGLLLASALAMPAEGRTAAVLELRNKLSGADRELIDATFLTDVVRQQALEAAPGLKLMTRENILVLLEATGRKLEDCEGECEVDTGRRLGADLVVTGEILRFGDGFRVNLRLHDTRSGRLLSAAVASGSKPEALEKDLARAVAKVMAPLTGARAGPTSRSLEWLAQRGGRLEAELRVSGGIFHFAGYNDGNQLLEPKAGAGRIDPAYGVGLRVGLLLLAPPDQDRLETGWSGFRVGSGLQYWQRSRPCLASQPCAATERVSWSAIELPVYVGAQWSFGSFGPPELWSGATFGADLLGSVVFQGTDAYQQANTDLRFGLGLHLDWTTFALDGKRIRPRLSLDFLPLKPSATGPVSSRDRTEGLVVSLGAVWR